MGAKKVTGNKQIDMIAAALEKKFGRPVLSKGVTLRKMDAVSTGSLSLDVKLGVGGLPSDRVIEIFGPESSGKTSLALQIVKQYTDKFGYERPPVFIDLERTTSIDLIEGIGLDSSQMIFSYPDTAQEALQTAQDLATSGAVGVIIFDSVDAAESEAMVARDIGQAGVGDLPRLMSQSLRRLSKIASDSNVMVIFINQIRMKIGVMYGNPETTSGGNALPYYSSVRLRVTSKLDSEAEKALKMKVKIVKNKTAAPVSTPAEFTFIAGQGVDLIADTISFAKLNGIIRFAGQAVFVTYEGEEEKRVCLGGKNGARAYYSDPLNSDAYAKLRRSCFRAAGVDVDGDEDPGDIGEAETADAEADG